MVTGAGVLRYQNNDTTRTRRHPRPFRPYSQEHARVLRARAHPRAGAGATCTRLLPWHACVCVHVWLHACDRARVLISVSKGVCMHANE